MKDKLIVALDVPDLKAAERLVKALSPAITIFKVGKELFTAAGPDAVRMVDAHGARVFLDLKFHDIPNTVGSACEAATSLGVFMLNVHISGGKNMLFQAMQSVHKAAEASDKVPPIVLGVTVLTSLTDRDLQEVGVHKKVTQQVERLAVLAHNCGLGGIVASPQEIKIVRQAVSAPFVIVTPGVRPLWAAKGDQKRVMTPKQAIQEGADYIVVGRPITQAADPREAAEKVLAEIKED